MTDHVIIHEDGSLSEGDGYPIDQVGCHGPGGQMLWSTRKYVDGVPFVLRMELCDCALMLLEEHAENPVARTVLLGLGHSQQVRGKMLLVCLGLNNEQVPLTATRLAHVRRLAMVGRSLRDHQLPLQVTRADELGVQVQLVLPVEPDPHP